MAVYKFLKKFLKFIALKMVGTDINGRLKIFQAVFNCLFGSRWVHSLKLSERVGLLFLQKSAGLDNSAGVAFHNRGFRCQRLGCPAAKQQYRHTES